MSNDTQLADLSDALIVAGIPILTLRRTSPTSATPVYDSSATQAQKIAGDALVAGWDWSAAAQQAADDARQPESANLRNTAAAAITTNDAFLAIATPTAAQIEAQVQALTRQNTSIIQYLLTQVS